MNFNNNVYSCGSQEDKTIIHRIMQRFRPIAPKPVTEGSSSSHVSAAEIFSTGRKKRKYVRVKKSNTKTTSSSQVEDRDDGYIDVTTRSNEKRSFTVSDFTPEQQSTTKPVDDRIRMYSDNNLSDLATTSRKVVESWLVVDGITETRGKDVVAELGHNDWERMRKLEMDTCPGLISDGDHRVQWINDAFRQTVVERDDREEVVVKLVVREKIPETCRVFSCIVRVMCNKYSQTMPCDVWRMDFGGFAWRLDATAALKLGL